MRFEALAPAKVNLFLHVAALAPDGYHPLSSLMTFADVGDRVSLEPAAGRSFELAGPFAAALQGEDPSGNLALRAVERLLDVAGLASEGFRLRLEKALPVAAGLGGGSSDAGAALRLARAAFAPELDDATLEAIAGELGSDGPACLWARPVLAEGRGERMSAAPATPPLPAVLVNPGVACPTGRVYRAYDAEPRPETPDRPALPDRFNSAEAAIDLFIRCRNDLEAPALGVAPQIGPVLERLRRAPQVRMARLSGSGATCFALCATPGDAAALAAGLQREEPGWWVKACSFGAPDVAITKA